MAVIIVLLLAAYIVIRRVLEKIRKQEVQMQINDYMGQIRDLEASGKEADEEIAKLRKQLKDYVYKKAPELLQGYKYYVQIKNDEIETLTKANMDRAAEKLFIDYYTAIDFRTVNRIKNVKRKEELTTHRLFFLLLVEMGKSDEYICKLFGISERSLAVIKTRTKPVEEDSA